MPGLPGEGRIPGDFRGQEYFFTWRGKEELGGANWGIPDYGNTFFHCGDTHKSRK